MSATRDKTQKFTFVYNNLYQIYKKSKNENELSLKDTQITDRPGLTTGQVLKVESMNHAQKVEKFEPVQFLRPQVSFGSIAEQKSDASRHREALSTLKSNLQTLNDLHSRLKFMLKEIEDLSKEK